MKRKRGGLTHERKLKILVPAGIFAVTVGRLVCALANVAQHPAAALAKLRQDDLILVRRPGNAADALSAAGSAALLTVLIASGFRGSLRFGIVADLTGPLPR